VSISRRAAAQAFKAKKCARFGDDIRCIIIASVSFERQIYEYPWNLRACNIGLRSLLADQVDCSGIRDGSAWVCKSSW